MHSLSRIYGSWVHFLQCLAERPRTPPQLIPPRNADPTMMENFDIFETTQNHEEEVGVCILVSSQPCRLSSYDWCAPSRYLLRTLGYTLICSYFCTECNEMMYNKLQRLLPGSRQYFLNKSRSSRLRSSSTSFTKSSFPHAASRSNSGIFCLSQEESFPA